MRKLLIIAAFTALLVLTACTDTKTLHCDKLGLETELTYNETEITKAVENGMELDEDQLLELNNVITESIENGFGNDLEDFLANHYAVEFEEDNGTCYFD